MISVTRTAGVSVWPVSTRSCSAALQILSFLFLLQQLINQIDWTSST